MVICVESALISFHIHATEDTEKVLRSVSETLGIPREAFIAQKLEGHFGNMITSFTAAVEGDESQKLFEKVINLLSPSDKYELGSSLESRIERNMFLYLRLDKQKLILGRVELGDSDPVKLKFRFPKASPIEISSLRVMLS